MIYLHVPFCRSFCIYCGFYSELAGNIQTDVPCGGRKVQFSGSVEERMERYTDAVLEEISHRKEEIKLSADSSVFEGAADTLYIGGGTPSVLPDSLLFRLLDALHSIFPPEHHFQELTIEVNPEDVVGKGVKYVEALMQRGVNRISMGVQSFDDRILKWMNRRHDSARALEAFRILREAGMDNISIDLIFGIPGLEEATWRATLEQALALHPEHISSYQLSIDDHSVLGKMAEEGRFREAPEEKCRRQYDLLCQILKEAGYHHYEISNWGLPGREALHNSAYWRRVPYVGLGPGAHSMKENQIRIANEESIPWKVETDQLTEEDVKVETIMLGLRTDNGVKKSYLYSHVDRECLETCLATGALVENGDSFRIPEDHFFVSDQIICDLI